MPLLFFVLLGIFAIIVFGAVMTIVSNNRKHKQHLTNYIDALNIETNSVNTNNPMERKLRDESYVTATYGFPVSILSDILILDQTPDISTLTMEAWFKRLPMYSRDTPANGIYRHTKIKNPECRLSIISGDIKIDVMCRWNNKSLAIDPLSVSDRETLTSIYHLWMCHDYTRLGILGFFKNLYDGTSYNKLIGGNVGLSDYISDRDTGACWWLHSYNADRQIHTYDISYQGDRYTIWISKQLQEYSLNGDYIDLPTFKQHIRGLIHV